MTYFLLFILGIICSLGNPPFNYSFASLCSISLFLYFLETANKAKTWLGFSFGYGYFIYSHHWLSNSLLTYGDELYWLFPIGVLFIPAFFALYFALLAYLLEKFLIKDSFVIAITWLMIDVLRSYNYIESPWLLIGYIWSDNYFVNQTAAIFSIWGLSFLTIFWAGSIKNILQKKWEATIIVAFISFVLCHVYGYYHLHSPLIAQDVKVRIIQSNIDQNIQSRINNRYSNLLLHMNLSKNADVDYVIWPEGANEYRVNDNLLALIKEAVPNNGHLIFNGSREKNGKHWNSLFVIDDKGKIVNFYDKMHLVALGEFIPFRTILPFINKITPGNEDYSRGNGVKVINNVKNPFLPSICYEAAFPEYSKEFYTWIANVTNDGWFGKSIGPVQHFSTAKFRSIEQGVPTVRAALTGISAIIDSFGFIYKSIPLSVIGVIDSNLPAYINGFTPYHLYGNYMVALLICIMYISIKLLSYKIGNKIY
jgi:apolipoprotein N-acyltransferase